MAIGTTLFGASLPAGSYSAGDVITLAHMDGPAVVRDGYGQPVLKSVVTGLLHARSGGLILGYVSVKNDNWIDAIVNGPSSLSDATFGAENGTAIQSGNDCPLVVNSGWTITFTVVSPVTTTVNNGVFTIIDIEYPSVGAVVSPSGESGIPCSIVEEFANVPVYQFGSFGSATWTVKNIDDFKAGAKYLMQKQSIYTDIAGSVYGFVAISGGASMGGLTRIMAYTSGMANIMPKIQYATVETKGPKDIKLMLFTNVTSATTSNIGVITDYVKRV